MGVEVKLLGIFKEAFGKSQVSLTVNDSRKLREILTEMIKVSPKLKRVLMDPELHDPRPNAVILVNEKEIGVLKGLETEVKDGDKIVLIPVTHGG